MTLRSIYLEDRSAPAHPSRTIQLTPRFDSITQQPIILWNDILKVYKGALYVLCQGASVPFLVNDQFEDLTPLRIAIYPGQVLDVVLENPNPIGSALTMDAMPLPSLSTDESKSVLTHPPPLPGRTPTGRSAPQAPQDYNSYSYSEDNERLIQALSIAPRNPQTAPEGISMYNSFNPLPPNLVGSAGGNNNGPQSMRPDDYSHATFQRNPQQQQQQEQIEQQIQLLANKVLTTRCYDSPGPSMFIAIPTPTRSWGKSAPSIDRLRLFWFCECTSTAIPNLHSSPQQHQHTSNSVEERVLRPHLYHHPALYINTPDQFIEKYGAYLLMNLWMFIHDRSNIRTNNNNSGNGHKIDYLGGMKVLQQALGLTQDQVELHLDTIISRLELAIPSTTFVLSGRPTPLKDTLEEFEDEDDCRVSSLVGGASSCVMLDAAGFMELRQMITQPDRTSDNSNNVMFTDEDDQAALTGHELYKHLAMDKDSSFSQYSRWICQSHYSDLHPTFDPEEFVTSIHGLGEYAPQPNLLGSHVQSSADFEHLVGSTLVQSGCLIDLVLQFSDIYVPSLKDWRMFREALRSTRMMHLVLVGPGLERMTSAQVKSVLRTVLELQWESFTVGNAQFLLKHVQELWNTSQEQKYGLRNIWLSVEIGSIAEDRDAMTNGFNNLVLNSPDLESVTLLWNEGTTAFGQGELLMLALAYKSYITRRSFKVALGTRSENFGLTLDFGNYYLPELTSTTLLQASQHFLTLAGQVSSLIISEPLTGLERVVLPLNSEARQWELCRDVDVVLFRILSMNRGMRLLAVVCERELFEVVVGMVDQIRRELVQEGASGVKGGDKGKGKDLELKELCLEDKMQKVKKTFTW
ncbi:MAG: hypothetical protein J3R72DRAFT_505139 [Linnemannia gamsii]|nr:MAG: hypothetical protein J3R72DRAFT_505139 [Linnemannia gamsii]